MHRTSKPRPDKFVKEEAAVTGTDTTTDNTPAATETSSGGRVSGAAVADPQVSVWGIAAAAVLDHTPAGTNGLWRAAGMAMMSLGGAARSRAACSRLLVDGDSQGPRHCGARTRVAAC